MRRRLGKRSRGDGWLVTMTVSLYDTEVRNGDQIRDRTLAHSISRILRLPELSRSISVPASRPPISPKASFEGLLV